MISKDLQILDLKYEDIYATVISSMLNNSEMIPMLIFLKKLGDHKEKGLALQQKGLQQEDKAIKEWKTDLFQLISKIHETHDQEELKLDNIMEGNNGNLKNRI